MTPRPSGEHMARVDCPRGHRQQVRVEIPPGANGLWLSFMCKPCKELHVVFIRSKDAVARSDAKVS